MTDQTTYVALIQQGMVLDQRVIAVGDSEFDLKGQAVAAAAELNEQQTGESEGYTAVVLAVPAP